jgi:sarcosine oxidase subunit gamma
MLVVRGNGADPAFVAAIRGALNFDLPQIPNTAAGAESTHALWLGPDEWLIATAPDDAMARAVGLKVALVGLHAAVTDIGDSRTVIRLSGPRAREILAKGCPLDLHPRAFGPGRVAQSLIARAGVVIHQADDAPSYDIYVLASFAAYLWNWLTDAGLEYGIGAGRQL